MENYRGKGIKMKYSKFILTASVGIWVAATSFGKTDLATQKTPDAAIVQMATAVANTRPQDLFKALPASYQKQISEVVSSAAKKMDAELWAEGRELFKSIVNVAKTKKDLILQARFLAQTEDKAALSKSWDDGVAMLTLILDSDITNLEKLREGNVELLLASTSDMMKKFKKIVSDQSDEDDDVFEKLKALKVTVVSQKGDTATVKVEMKDEDPEMVEMVRVDGTWIPKEFADGFAEEIKEVKESIAGIDFTSEQGKAMKAQIMQQLSMVKMMVKQAEMATTSQQFDNIMMGLMMGAMTMGGGGAMPPSE